AIPAWQVVRRVHLRSPGGRAHRVERGGISPGPDRLAPASRDLVLPPGEGADAGRLLHVANRRHPGAASESVRRVPRRHTLQLRREGLVMITYDAIVIGSGITGGWAAKELTEKGLQTLMIERGRDVVHRKDYITEHKPSWELPLRDARL